MTRAVPVADHKRVYAHTLIGAPASPLEQDRPRSHAADATQRHQRASHTGTARAKHVSTKKTTVTHSLSESQDLAVLEAELLALQEQPSQSKTGEPLEFTRQREIVDVIKKDLRANKLWHPGHSKNPSTAATRLRRMHEQHATLLTTNASPDDEPPKRLNLSLDLQPDSFPALEPILVNISGEIEDLPGKHIAKKKSGAVSYALVLKENTSDNSAQRAARSSGIPPLSETFVPPKDSPASRSLDAWEKPTEHLIQCSSPMFGTTSASSFDSPIFIAGATLTTGESCERSGQKGYRAVGGAHLSKVALRDPEHANGTVQPDAQETTTEQRSPVRHKRKGLPEAWMDCSDKCTRDTRDTPPVKPPAIAKMASKGNLTVKVDEQATLVCEGTKVRSKDKVVGAKGSRTTGGLHYAAPTAASRLRAVDSSSRNDKKPNVHMGSPGSRLVACDSGKDTKREKSVVISPLKKAWSMCDIGAQAKTTTGAKTKSNGATSKPTIEKANGALLRPQSTTSQPKLTDRIPSRDEAKVTGPLSCSAASAKDPCHPVAPSALDGNASDHEDQSKPSAAPDTNNNTTERSALLAPIRRRLSSAASQQPRAVSDASSTTIIGDIDRNVLPFDGALTLPQAPTPRGPSASFRVTWRKTSVDVKTGRRKVVETSVEEIPSFSTRASAPHEALSTTDPKSSGHTVSDNARIHANNEEQSGVLEMSATPRADVASKKGKRPKSKTPRLSDSPGDPASVGKVRKDSAPCTKPPFSAVGSAPSAAVAVPTTAEPHFKTPAKPCGLRATAPSFVPSITTPFLPFRDMMDSIRTPQSGASDVIAQQVTNQATPTVSIPSDVAKRSPTLPSPPASAPQHTMDNTTTLAEDFKRGLPWGSDEQLLGRMGEGNNIGPWLGVDGAASNPTGLTPRIPATVGPASMMGALNILSSIQRDGPFSVLARRPMPSVDKENSDPASTTPAQQSALPTKQSKNLRGWTIGPAQWEHLRPFGWRGGDGKEIRFYGGPGYVEKDPNRPLECWRTQGYQGSAQTRPQSSDLFVTNPFDAPSPRAPTEPKRMRQWAERKGYPMVPCGTFDIIQAAEHIPGTAQSDALCHSCFPDR